MFSIKKESKILKLGEKNHNFAITICFAAHKTNADSKILIKFNFHFKISRLAYQTVNSGILTQSTPLLLVTYNMVKTI